MLRTITAAAGAALAIAVAAVATPPVARGQGPNVLLVGPAGTPGAGFTSIQDAVDHAQPGDWVIVAPGVYHEKGSDSLPHPAGVLIRTPGIHLRGMDRDRVIVDGSGARGTQPPGSPACSSSPAAQDPGVTDSSGNNHVREGILVDHVSGVSVENLTACNYLDNEIWWNNGDGSGKAGPMAIVGDYISATSTYFKDGNSRSAQYGIFTSNESGPGLIDHSYASNMTDSSYYIGACRDCNMVLRHAHAENSALGLSSTNAGGNFIVEDSEWDLNRTGLVSNAQNNDDAPSPQLGQCVAPSTPPAQSMNCDTWRHNYIHDNNNPNTPGSGLTSVSAIGTGVELVATQHISVIDNVISNQGSWGIVAHDFPDPESGIANCQGGIPVNTPPQFVCLYFSRGNEVGRNRMTNTGFFGNPTNADVANQASGLAAPPDTPEPNCFHDNTDAAGSVSVWPPALQTLCPSPGDTALLTAQLICATNAGTLFNSAASCPSLPTLNYPRHDGACVAPAVLTPAGDRTNGVCFLPLSRTVDPAISPPMPTPCSGPPANAFCGAGAVAAATGAPPLPNTSTAARAVGTAVAAAALAAAAAIGVRRRRRLRG